MSFGFWEMFAVVVLLTTLFLLTRNLRALRTLNHLNQELCGQVRREQEQTARLATNIKTVVEMFEREKPEDIAESFVRYVSGAFVGAKAAVFLTRGREARTGLKRVHTNFPEIFRGEVSQLKKPVQGGDFLSSPLSEPLLIYEIQAGLDLSGYALVSKPPEMKESCVFENQIFALVKQMNACIQKSYLVRRVEDCSLSKTAFLANTSHEIRTPLNVMLGFCEMLTRDDLKPAMRAELMAGIHSNGQQLLRIIDDILDLSKIESGKKVVTKSAVNLNMILREVKNLMQDRARAKLLQLDFVVDAHTPDVVETDPLRLKQVLMNIVGNAIKFTDVGHVRLTVRHETGAPTGYLDFLIEDTGIGINESDRPGLFEPFTQADESYTRRFGGTGLGLAVSRRLARELGGDLSLKSSTPSLGSVFHLRIESGRVGMSMPAKSPIIQPERRSAHLSNLDILLVEDSLDNQDFFTYYLSKAGAKVSVVGDGFEAVQKAKRNDFDLILMDVQMPGIDGKEATRRIRSGGYKGPIVALTAHAMAEEKRSCLEAGCAGHIAKPVSGQQLVSEVFRYTQPEDQSLTIN